MRRWLSVALAAGTLSAAVAGIVLAQNTGVNPVVGSVWTYLGATYGAGWVVPPAVSSGYVANNAALAVTTLTTTQVYRAGFRTPGDGGAMTYTHQVAACSLNGGVGDNGSQVKAVDGGCWIADFNATPRNALQFGADATGATDSTVALQACLNSAADGNTCFLGEGVPDTKTKLTGQLTIPRAATLDCGLKAMTDMTPPMLASTDWGPALRIDPTKPILFGDTSGRIENCLIIPNGMVFPQANATAWTGTAIDTNGKVNPQIFNTTIVGFDTCINTTTGGGSQRPYLARLHLDCTGLTSASLVTGNNGDIATVTDVKLQPLGTASTCPAHYRLGTGLKLVGYAWVDNLIAMNFKVSAINIQGAAQIMLGRIWIDGAGANPSCPAAGMFIADVEDLDIQHLDIQSVVNGVQITNAANRTVHIHDLWLNTIGNDGVQIGNGVTSGGYVQIDMIRINSSSLAASTGGYAVNMLDPTHNSHLTIGGGQIWKAHGGVAPYISIGGSPAANVNISEDISTDLAQPFLLWGPTTLVACTGVGTGGCAFLNSFRTTPWGGTIVLSPTAGTPAANGEAAITWPTTFSNSSGCVAAYKAGTNAWPGTPVPLQIVDQSTSNTKIVWASSAALIVGQQYHLIFECKPQ